MGIFEEELLEEINWRTNEISILKTIPFLYPLSKEQKETLQKHSIPAMYSLWEGFVVASFSLYIREINRLKLTKDKINLNILVHAIDVKYQLNNGRTDFNKKVKLVDGICKYIGSEICIPSSLPTESNVNFKVINNILDRFSLSPLPEKPFKDRLNKLLLVRNSIAHGENSIPITQSLVTELSFTVLDSMHEVFNRILEGYKNKTYLQKRFMTDKISFKSQN
ncbi:hypothetical protein DXT63_09715 [Thermoanaerobacteraceae bacterium SP2]|nr:hypothetical protein DXT63_09715 [Thermoanaerobacteraceae bacterium SP2]